MSTSNIKSYKSKDFTELLGGSVKAFQCWDREDTLKANPTPADRRIGDFVSESTMTNKKNQLLDDVMVKLVQIILTS